MTLEPLTPVNLIDYDECIDITKEDEGNRILEKTGVHPFEAFRIVLKEDLGYTDKEIYDYELTTVKKKGKIKYTDIVRTVEIPAVKYTGLLVDHNLLPVEEIKKLRKNSKYKKDNPEMKYTYELKYVSPFKYRNVLIKLGVDVSTSDYWSNLEKYIK